MYCIVGLGNPGEEYAGTRHNIGREVVFAFAREWRLQKKLHAEVAKKDDALLALPTTYMNDSGKSVQRLLSTFKFQLPDVLVVHDDLDLPLGTLRFSQGSGAAGQKGVQSIIDAVGAKNFARLRIGVAGKHRATTDAAEYVLKKFARDEQSVVRDVKKRAEDALRDFIKKPLAEVMNIYNK